MLKRYSQSPSSRQNPQVARLELLFKSYHNPFASTLTPVRQFKAKIHLEENFRAAICSLKDQTKQKYIHV